MSVIDWTNQGFIVSLTAAGAILIVLGVLFYFLPAARIKGLALLVGIVGGLGAGTALGLFLMRSAPATSPDKPTELPTKEPSPQAAKPPDSPASARKTSDALERFRQATPAERMVQLNRLPDAATAWYTVQRGDVSLVIERGSLESADNIQVRVQVRSRNSNSANATTIRKLLVQNGEAVRKGQLLVELDETPFRERLAVQKAAVEQEKIALTQIQQQAKLDRERSQLDVEEAQHQLTLAERDLKAYTGSDAERKKGLELKVKEAQHLVKTRQLQISKTQTRTEVAERTAQASLANESALVKELESDIANCKITAPRDGVVIFYVPETSRWGASGLPLAEGEGVKGGQILMEFPDLAKMQVRTRIHESQIAFVRPGQTVHVRVDAFPGRALTGKVGSVPNVADQDAAWTGAVVYSVIVTLANEKLPLKPGMSAEVRIQVPPRRDVLRVPPQAVVRHLRETICFVKSGNEIEERPAATGLNAEGFTEITRGVREGEQVLRDPRGVVQRLAK